MEGSSSPESSSPEPPATDSLDTLIAAYQELAKQVDGRRQRAYGSGATLITAAIALGAALVTAAKALDDPGPLTGWAGYVILGGLLGAFLAGGATLATSLQYVALKRPTEAQRRWDDGEQAICRLRQLADCAATNPSQVDAVELRQGLLRLWRTYVEANEHSLRYQYWCQRVGGFFLSIALMALALTGVTVLSSA